MKNFCKITIILNSILKTSLNSSESQSSKAVEELNSETGDGNRNSDIEFLAKSKNPTNLSNNIKAIRPDFLTIDTKKTFNRLRQAFIKSLIL